MTDILNFVIINKQIAFTGVNEINIIYVVF